MAKTTKAERAAALVAEARSATFRVACVETAGECIGVLRPDSRIVAVTKGQFSMLDLIRAVLAQIGPAHLLLSTWTSGIRDVENASWLLDTGELLSVRILTDRSFATRQPEYCRLMVQRFGETAIHATRTHAKFAVITNAQWAITIRGSMNLNRNTRCENFDLDTDPEIAAFFTSIADEFKAMTEPGPSPGEAHVNEVFEKALQRYSCGDRISAEQDITQRLAGLGYTRDEIQDRAQDLDTFQRGSAGLEDAYREATRDAALGGDPKARHQLDLWIGRQKRDW